MATTTDNQSTAPKAKKTGVPSAQPRLTMKQLHTEQVNLADVQRETNDKLESVQRKVNQQRHLIETLERQAKGTTLANAEVAKVKASLATMEGQLAALRKSSGNVKTDATDEVIAGAYVQEFERINTRLTDFFNTLNGQDTTLREELETLTGRVSAVEGDVSLLRYDHNELHSRFTAFAKLRDAVPWGRIILALIAGVIAGFWTWNFMLARNTLQDGTIVNIEIVWFVAILVGLGTFGMILGLLHWVRSRNQQEVEQPQAPAVPVNRKPITHTPSAPAADDAPTKVLVTQGAESGTR